MPRSTAIVLLVACFVCSQALPDGAPADACKDLVPQHGKNEPQKTPSPYKITAVRDGNRIKVTIGSTDGNQEFKGFLVAAEDCSGKRLHGKFVTNADAQGLACNDKDDSAATHVDNTPKKTVTVYYESPADQKGKDICITGSVAKDGKIFWVNLKSNPVQGS